MPPWVPGTFLEPQEALEAFTSLWQPLAALGLQSYSGAVLSLLPLTPLTFSHSLLPPLVPEPSWVSLGSWDFPGASGSLGSLQQPWVFSETQRPCFPCPPSPPLAPSCSLSPLSLPGFAWAPGTFLGPQEDLGAFASLWQPWVFSETQGPCFPCSPSPPLAPSHSLYPPEAP